VGFERIAVERRAARRAGIGLQPARAVARAFSLPAISTPTVTRI